MNPKRIKWVTMHAKKRLSSNLVASGWTDITTLPFIGKLQNDYLIYKRERPKLAVFGQMSNDFSNYASLRNIYNPGNDFIVAFDSEWQECGEGENSFRFVLSWQYAFFRDDTLVEVVFIATNLKNRLDTYDALSILYCIISC